MERYRAWCSLWAQNILFCTHAGGPLQGRRSPAITAIASDCLWGHHIAGQRAASLITGPGARLI
jgi:hypothetical protein